MKNQNQNQNKKSIYKKPKIYIIISFWILTIYIFKKWDLCKTLKQKQTQFSILCLSISLLCLLIFFINFFYLIFYVPFVNQKKINWKNHTSLFEKYGFQIKLTTGSAILSAPFFILSIWDVYNYASLFITIVLWFTLFLTLSLFPFRYLSSKEKNSKKKVDKN
ncbi:transmembrane protein [Anaeramoeba ignava]|uniref:Transmembrane protein n=1 Tax=Anaeramoeba ignava TaxID=1746090 RepID=A0A9Q0LPH2_ANAIG|nr:transmembrane protein [Anaeramoeba ignava]